MDGGATCRMTGARELFESFTEFDSDMYGTWYGDKACNAGLLNSAILYGVRRCVESDECATSVRTQEECALNLRD
jgi:hypothetical protein